MADGQNSQIAEAITEVTNRATLIIHEEIELAKAEMSQKISKLAKAAAVGAAAGIFVVVGLLFLLHGAAWGFWAGLYKGSGEWLGYLTVAGILFVLAALAGLLAFKWVKGGTPPTPVMAIDEAKKVKETVTSSKGSAG
jgi:uncharacterized membrane protein YqjE